MRGERYQTYGRPELAWKELIKATKIQLNGIPARLKDLEQKGFRKG